MSSTIIDDIVNRIQTGEVDLKSTIVYVYFDFKDSTRQRVVYLLKELTVQLASTFRDPSRTDHKTIHPEED